MKKLLTALFLLTSLTAFTQSVFNTSTQLEWQEPVIHSIYPDADTEIPQFLIYRFSGAKYKANANSLPLYSVTFDVPRYGNLRANLTNDVWEPFEKEVSEDDVLLAENLKIETAVAKERLQHKGIVSFFPIRKNGSGFERLVSFDLRVSFNAQSYPNPIASSRDEYPTVSVFADADESVMFKIPISQTGMYKLDKAYLDGLGISTSTIDPRTIKIYGNGGGMLEEMIDAPRYNDLEENPIKVLGEDDGSFDAGDAVIFYAEGPHKWSFDIEEQSFERMTNIYANENYYFLKISSGNGLRVDNNTRTNLSGATYTTSQFSDHQIYEEDIQNLLDKFTQGYGTGQEWYGDSYKLQRERTYTGKFNFPNIISEEALIEVGFAARADVSSTTLKVSIEGNTYEHENQIGSVATSSIDGQYARRVNFKKSYIPSNSNPDVTIEYPNIGSSEGWLDHITINARRALIMTGDIMTFRDIRSFGESVTRFNLTASSDVEVWDITNPVQAALQTVDNNGGAISFGSGTSDILRQFIAFKPSASLLTPMPGTAVSSQNLHSISDVDMLIVYHPNFESQARQLAEHRANYSNMDVAIADINQIYNEFSSGKQDPAAIREMGKMLFERNPDRFKYLLLFGDGSFDARGISLGPDQTAQQYVPVYETKESLAPINGFPTDDFFGLITEGEGQANIGGGLLDLAVGRIPVRTASQAQAMVNKIIRYDVNKESFGDWRNRILHVADNGDGNRHQIDCDEVAEKTRAQNKVLNIDKIYLDAYQRVATTGDARVPDANEALNNNIFKGSLAIVYLGHGGPGGWTQERVLRKDDIFNWDNIDKLPLFITATCTFSGFDAALDVSAGEEVFLNEEGGAIALFSTVRPVFASQNAALTDSVANKLFREPELEGLPMGEILRIAKNNFSGQNNPRKFLMIGDPSQKLAVPRLNVVTTKINEIPTSEGVLDTLSALEKITIEGEIRNFDGTTATDFNGVVYPTIYDKVKVLSTLGQISGSSKMDYNLRKNVIFKGRASVTNGKFQFTFIAPKDIDYNYGEGKISYYAADESNDIDAAGASCDLIIGGINEDALTDNEGPEVEVFMNTWEWVSGGTTSESPTLLVRLSDDLGINVVGNSIGHDLTGLLDNNSQNTYLLNDFYESELDDYTKGTVRFPLKDIESGVHEIKVKAWDSANNSAEGVTEFIVAESAAVALTNVLNYPNPFVNRTCFMFDHNQIGDIDVLVSIYTVSGRLVKTIEERIDGGTGKVTRENCLEWDGKDDFGDDLAQGVYLYKVRLRNSSTGVISDKKESEFEKLVIIK
jgi:hypothetical protein